MKYFNHLSCAGDDEKVQRVRDKYGTGGYGIYFLVLEKIASQIRKESGSTSLTLTIRKWSAHLDIRPGYALEVIDFITECGLWETTLRDDKLTINAPNILKYADEYSRKVGLKSKASPDKSPDAPPDVLRFTGSKEGRKDKRSTAAIPAVGSGDANKQQPNTDNITDPRARAQAMQTIREATGLLDRKPKAGEPKSTENGKIPTATGPEVEAMGCSLQDAEFKEPLIQDVLNAWWANRNGTHDVFAIAEALDKHGVKGQDRSRLYAILGVV